MPPFTDRPEAANDPQFKFAAPHCPVCSGAVSNTVRMVKMCTCKVVDRILEGIVWMPDEGKARDACCRRI